MSTTEDTSAIDEKKSEDTGGSSPDFKGFIKNYISSIVFTIGGLVFIIGGLGLYTTKVAQANILPDNINLAPYTIIDRILEKNIPVDINVMRPNFLSENKDTFSQKAIFNSQEYLDSFSNSFLCSLKDKANPNNNSNAALYFSHVYDNLVSINLLAINTIFFYLSYFPESIIMILYGFFGIFIWIVLYLLNIGFSMVYHFINIPELFREPNLKTEDSDNFQWESNSDISFIRFFKLILFFFIWIPIGLISTFVSPIFFTIYGLISPLFSSYTIDKNNKKCGIYDFIRDTFSYKRFFFFILATISLFSNAYNYLGSNSVIGIIVAVVFAYFMGLYTNEMPDNGVNGFTSKITQNIKQASIKAFDKTKLVEICPRIDIDDNKMNDIIKNGTFRQLTKIKTTGGDINNSSNPISSNPYNPSVPNPYNPSNPNPYNPSVPISSNPYNPSVPISSNPISSNPISSNPYNPSVPTSESQIQSGGKRRNSFNTTKKYNIRLV